MLIKELKEKLKEGNGKILGKNFVITHSAGEDIDVKDLAGNLVAYLSTLYLNDDDEQVVEKISIMNAFRTIPEFIELARYFGLQVGDIKPEIITVKEKVEDHELVAQKARADGKVEAYEKILIGRSVTVSK